MSSKPSKFEFYEMATLSQRAARRVSELPKLAGTDPNTSLLIALLLVLDREEYIDLKGNKDLKLFYDILQARRLALFATSDKLNDISRFGMLLPSDEEEDDLAEPEPSNSVAPKT